MKSIIFCMLLIIHLVTNSLAASKTKTTELHRSRRSVVIKAIHNIWLSRRKRDVDIDKLVLLRRKLTRMRRSLAVGPTKAVKVEIKFLTNWMDEMADHSSTPYRMMDGNILDAVFTELIGDVEYIESKVITLQKSNDKVPRVLADIEFDFDQSEEDPLMHLREIVATGRISGMEVSPNYFIIFDNKKPTPNKQFSASNASLDVAAGPTYAPTVFTTLTPTTAVYTGPYQEFQYDIKLKRPWDPRLNDNNNNETKNFEDHIQSVIKIIFDNEPNFVDDQVSSISDGPDEHPFVRIVLRFKPGDNNPEAKVLQLVKSGLLGDIPIFEDYLNGQLPGTKPPVYTPQNAQQVDQQPQPTQTLVPYQPQENVPPPAPLPTQSYATVSQGPKLPGHFVLDQTWYPFMDDPKSATDKILSDTIANAIKEAYKPLDVDVKITGLSRTPDNKIRADFTITFPFNATPSLKPLNDGIATGILGGLPVIGEKPADATSVPSTSSSRTLAPTNGYSQSNQSSVQVASQAAPTQAAPTQAAVTQPATTQAVVTQPATTQAVVTQPATTQAVVTQPPLTQAAQTQTAAASIQVAAPAPAAADVPILSAKPPVISYHGDVVPLPSGIPSSCEEIRSCGIGNQDGEYVIKARPNCHLSIICQNMDDSHPKEYLGGPAQNQWLYWHYAVLVKLSSHDKESIDKRACLENTAVGREFVAKVMAAGARQGNPLVPWKTNIKRMIHSYIGDKRQKKRRSLEDMDITLSTKAVKIYKRFAIR